MAHQSDLIGTDIEAYLHQHEHKGLLRFITCGSVDDGKSTLIGRLLHDSKMIFEDQLAAITNDSRTMGKAGEGELDLALLVDGLASEREQGITIDVAYRFFSTDRRKFIIADTPGHEQYTRNMATGASTAEAAVILIDARHGVQTQTRRHSFICSLLGIRHLVVAINKMDLVDFRQDRFKDIQDDYRAFARQLGIEQIEFIPMSALKGDNVVTPSEHMGWYTGPTLTEWLESVDLESDFPTDFTRLPVQSVVRPDLSFRGFTGTLEAGALAIGDEITVFPGGRKTRVAQLYLAGDPVEEAHTNQAVLLTTTDEVDISRGSMIVKGTVPTQARRSEADLVWMTDTPLVPGKEYLIKCGTLVTPGRLERLSSRTDVNTLERAPAERLELNEIGTGVLNTNDPLIFDAYGKLRATGSFIVIDRMTNITVGAGLLRAEAEDNGDAEPIGRDYTEAERALNAYIREHFPEWGCKAI
ncbi:sulfate adenylyltransferase subunit CysN [Saccharospirillum salsuginis]|uniref:Sulfate adenylyltransferase subunit 1 n=1 Tax=Saccharospirillum salsuginis TaxID=418750 RepID=A0A918KEA0_9GAMM|nr:sulfate adenylyltransferase subunit CysN [Saccharospirillum salsuginis]GGX60151.1 sulfate adenylyltransferase subunit 1 [Saccharospirillum salsuginis]